MTHEDKPLAAQAHAQVSANQNASILFDSSAFEQAQRVANLLSKSQLVPQHLQGKPADCFLALHMAHRLGEDPLMVAQNIVIIQGTPGWKSQFLIARANRAGVFKSRITFEEYGSGDDLEVVARATLADTGQEVTAKATMAMAKREQWTKNPKYQSMPEQMLAYRSGCFLIRKYCPEVTLGYQAAEEVEDVVSAGQAERVDQPAPTQSSKDALAALGQQSEPQQTEEAPATQDSDPDDAAPESGAQESSLDVDSLVNDIAQAETEQAIRSIYNEVSGVLAGSDKQRVTKACKKRVNELREADQFVRKEEATEPDPQPEQENPAAGLFQGGE